MRIDHLYEWLSHSPKDKDKDDIAIKLRKSLAKMGWKVSGKDPKDHAGVPPVKARRDVGKGFQTLLAHVLPISGNIEVYFNAESAPAIYSSISELIDKLEHDLSRGRGSSGEGVTPSMEDEPNMGMPEVERNVPEPEEPEPEPEPEPKDEPKAKSTTPPKKGTFPDVELGA